MSQIRHELRALAMRLYGITGHPPFAASRVCRTAGPTRSAQLAPFRERSGGVRSGFERQPFVQAQVKIRSTERYAARRTGTMRVSFLTFDADKFDKGDD